MTTRTLPDDLVLKNGQHDSLEDGACLMEAVSWLAGEPWSDSPACACPILAAYARRLNDAVWPTDQDRSEALKPIMALLIGSVTNDEKLEAKRRWHLADAAVRQFAPLALDKRWPDRAAALRLLPPLTVDNWKEARNLCSDTCADGADGADAAYAAIYAATDSTATAARLNILRLAADVLRQACLLTVKS